MREILFRGKRADNGEWTTGTPFFVKDRCKMIHAVAVHPDFLCEGNVYYSEGYPVIPDTIGEYTGLTDKNGKKIFEGDIVHMNSKKFGLSGHGVVVYRNGGFAIYDRKRNRLYPFMQNGQYNAGDYRVVGNIHDHKELLHDSKV